MTHNFKLGDSVLLVNDQSPYQVTGIKANSVEITGDFSGIGACIQSDWVDPLRIEKCKPSLHKQLIVKWNKLKDHQPEVGIEVIGFHRDWIDEDFNPDGIRICFLNGDEQWYQAMWVDYQDSYNTYVSETGPSHWIPRPNKPQI